MLNILKQPIYLNRIKTFGWNLLYMTLAFTVAIATDVVPQLGLSEVATIIVSTALAQVSKFVHEKNK